MKVPRKLAKLLQVSDFLELLKEKGKPRLITVDYEAKLQDATKIMVEREFSQLPVEKGKKIVGVISFGSVVKTLHLMKESIEFSKLMVKDFMEIDSPIDAKDLFEILNTLADKSFILIETNTKPTGVDIITSYDALNYFREYSENFLMLNDIESNLRGIISEKYNRSAFKEKAKIIFENGNQKGKRKPPKVVEKMTFGNCIYFISSDWDQFGSSFGNEIIFNSLTNRARNIRNKICHFNGPIDKSEKECLRIVFNWLETKTRCSE
jgi:predicted transcriptional regulator